MSKNPENSMSSYIMAERFKNNATTLLNTTLDALELSHYKMLVTEDVINAIGAAYNENYTYVLKSAFANYPEATQELVDSVQIPGEVTNMGQLATLIISELVTNLTICQVILKMVMAVNENN